MLALIKVEEKEGKSKHFFLQKNLKPNAIFWEKLVSTVDKTVLKPPFNWPHHSYMNTSIQLETTPRTPCF